jgi:hypothetical protein
VTVLSLASMRLLITLEETFLPAGRWSEET